MPSLSIAAVSAKIHQTRSTRNGSHFGNVSVRSHIMVQFIRMDRRPLPRFSFRCEVELSQNGNGAPLRGVISDISVSGCYVETITPEPEGTRLELRFQVNGQPMRFPGIVRAVHATMG